MLNLDITNRCNIVPQLGTTMWHCDRCDAFISIRSVQLPDEIFCPACGQARLDFCGRLSSMAWVQFGDA